MSTLEFGLIFVLLLILLIIAITIWKAIFTSRVRALQVEISELVVVIDIALAMKKEFLMKVNDALDLSEKKLPKTLKIEPHSSWENLERELFLKALYTWEKIVVGAYNNLGKKKKEALLKDLLNVKDTEIRLQNYLLKYNNSVLKYNDKLDSSQGKFFLNQKKFLKRNFLNVQTENNMTSIN